MLIFLKPGELFTHIFTRVGLYLSNRFFACDKPVEIKKRFLVPNGIEGIFVTMRVNGECLVEKSVLNHVQNALINASVHLFAVTI